MWTTNYVQDASSTQTAMAGTCHTNERRNNPKDILCGELVAGKHNLRRLQLDVCKWDMKELSNDLNK